MNQFRDREGREGKGKQEVITWKQKKICLLRANMDEDEEESDEEKK
jgi:hypothetical protein